MTFIGPTFILIIYKQSLGCGFFTAVSSFEWPIKFLTMYVVHTLCISPKRIVSPCHYQQIYFSNLNEHGTFSVSCIVVGLFIILLCVKWFFMKCMFSGLYCCCCWLFFIRNTVRCTYIFFIMKIGKIWELVLKFDVTCPSFYHVWKNMFCTFYKTCLFKKVIFVYFVDFIFMFIITKE